MELFAEVETFLFIPWVLYGIAAILICISCLCLSKEDQSDISFVAFCCSLLLAFLLGRHYGLTWQQVKTNPLIDLGFALSYVAAGVLWSLFKWYTLVTKLHDTFIDNTATWLDKNGITKEQLTGDQLPAKLNMSYIDYMRTHQKNVPLTFECYSE